MFNNLSKTLKTFAPLDPFEELAGAAARSQCVAAERTSNSMISSSNSRTLLAR